MAISNILGIPTLSENQASAFTTVNAAISALERSVNSKININLAADVVLSTDESTRSFFYALAGNTTPRTLTFRSRNVYPADVATPYTQRVFFVYNGGAATATITSDMVGTTSVVLAVGETAICHLDAKATGTVITKLLSSTGGGGGGGGGSGSGVFTAAVFIPGALSAGTLLRMVVTEPNTFLDDFAGSRASVSTNPAAPLVVDVYRNITKIGSVTIATTGVATFVTTAAASEAFVAGDVLSFVATASSTATNLAITLKGVR